MDKILIAANIRSVYNVPLIYENLSIGTLNVGSNLIDAFSEDIRHILVLLAHRLALALQNAILHNQVKQTMENFRESEEKYRTLVIKAQDGIAIVQDG
jgi:GAF domain-containing protein